MRTSVTHEADPRDNEHTLPCIPHTAQRTTRTKLHVKTHDCQPNHVRQLPPGAREPFESQVDHARDAQTRQR